MNRTVANPKLKMRIRLHLNAQLDLILRSVCAIKGYGCFDLRATWDDLEILCLLTLEAIRRYRERGIPLHPYKREQAYSISGFVRDAIVKHLRMVLHEELEQLQTNEHEEK